MMGGFGANGDNNSWEITLPELGNMLMGGNAGVAGSYVGGFPAAIRRNIKVNGLSALGQMITIPLAFKIGRKVLAKPLINPINRAARSVGIKEVKL